MVLIFDRFSKCSPIFFLLNKYFHTDYNPIIDDPINVGPVRKVSQNKGSYE